MIIIPYAGSKYHYRKKLHQLITVTNEFSSKERYILFRKHEDRRSIFTAKRTISVL